MLLLGIDVGSSSVKVYIMDGQSGKNIASTFYPKVEMPMISQRKGWAEQAPETWWDSIKMACRELFVNHNIDRTAIQAIGISYQMHGLVMVDKDQNVLRPSIIWCDSRAVEIGRDAFNEIGPDLCLDFLLNSPGNFTASKLKWVKENEPELYKKIHKIMLPGDYIAMKLTGEIHTTASGLSEGILWDFRNQDIAHLVLDHYGIDPELLPPLIPTFGDQGALTAKAAEELGLQQGTKVTYRAGDQPNNAFALNVLEPGDIAATAGTSGVVYAVTDQLLKDEQSRVNTFLHVSNTAEKVRNGILLCVNGTGILYSWLRRALNMGGKELSYSFLNQYAEQAPIGADGLRFYPFGNGAERILQNQQPNASMQNLDFNTHTNAHLVRAAQEGIAFAMNYGLEVLNEIGAGGNVVKAGRVNMFLSPLFRDVFVNVTQTSLKLYNTGGAEGAARAAGVGIGYYADFKEAFLGLACLESIDPSAEKMERYQEAYALWKEHLPVTNQACVLS